MRICDVMLSFPTFFLIITVIAFLPPSNLNIMLVIGFIGWTGIFRLVRGEVMKNKGLDYVMAADPVRELLTVAGPFPFFADRQRALYGSWYEFFPRSEGAVKAKDGTWTSAQVADWKPPMRVFDVARAPDGTLAVATDKGTAILRDGRWTVLGDKEAHAVAIAGDGAIWAGEWKKPLK